ncbi:MAG: hypothetical protein NC416_16985 [Eubacterium sp.]|nr:hypothetical protein [Eubacterium sp.]
MADSEIRIGKVSSVDYEKGMMKVTYADKDDAVTVDFAMLNYNDEYRMPKVGQQVAVAHLSNGSSRGIVLGQVWNQKNMPQETGESLYRKDLSSSKDAAYIRYDDGSGEYLVKVANLHLNGVNKTVLDGPELEIAANLSILLQTDEMQMDVPVLVLTAGGEDAFRGEIKTDVQIEQEENELEALILKAALELKESLEIKTGTEMKLEAVEDVEVSAGKTLRLKDEKYDITLTEIMERLEALGG